MSEENVEEKVVKSKKRMKQGKFLAISLPIMAVGIAAMIAVPIVMNAYGPSLDGALGRGAMHIKNPENAKDWDVDYYLSKNYPNSSETQKTAAAASIEIANEGITLLKNNNNCLPLAKNSKVTALGRRVADPIYGGSGSGNVKTNLPYVITPIKALKESFGDGLNTTVTDKLVSLSSDAKKYPTTNIVMDKPAESFYGIGEIPVADYTDDVWNSVDSSSTALVMLGRGGGEGGDLTHDMSKNSSGGTSAEHQLQLDKNEKDLIEKAKAKCDKVVIILNMSTSMELGELALDNDIDAIVWVGSPGATGFKSMCNVLVGDVNPSGRTIDTFAADFTKDPTYDNFGDKTYTDITPAQDSNGQANWRNKYVEYEEGIYVGYRYYETAFKEKGQAWYDNWKGSADKASGTGVVYPFGYGLSYTTFDQKIKSHEVKDGKINVTVTVTNKGTVAGKDTVQLYYTAPYTKGGIEKAYVNLVAFKKTDTLAKDESKDYTLSFDIEDMASYDYKDAKAYVLDQGDYEIKLMENAHKEYQDQKFTYNVKSKEVYNSSNPRKSEKDAQTKLNDDGSLSANLQKASVDSNAKVIAATNLFESSNEYAKEQFDHALSRNDWDNTFPTDSGDKAAPKQFKENLAAIDVNTDTLIGNVESSKVYHKEEVKDSAEKALTLVDLRGKDFYDPAWDTLLDQLTYSDDEWNAVLGAAYNTKQIKSIGKPATADYDGPQGWSSFMEGYIDPKNELDSNSCAYPSEALIAATWNVDLAKKMGQSIGQEALALNVKQGGGKLNGWYGPAMNIHRTPFSGRNFEYYSEDPLVSGQMALNAVNGAGEYGVYSCIKHFAINDQETNRIGVSSQLNEQAMREIYFKPFEIVVKNARMKVDYISNFETGEHSTKIIRGATGVMSSLNRIGGKLASENYSLLTSLLRDEWGYQGFTITDMNAGFDQDAMLRAGTDVRMGFGQTVEGFKDRKSNTAKYAFRNAIHNFGYTIANSNAMNKMAPGAEISYDLSGWQIGLIIGEVAVGVLELGAVAWIALRFFEKKNHPEWYAN